MPEPREKGHPLLSDLLAPQLAAVETPETAYRAKPTEGAQAPAATRRNTFRTLAEENV